MAKLTKGEELFRFHCKAVGLPAPVSEYQFGEGRHAKRLWRFDFAWPDSKIAVEIEGGTRSNPVKCNRCGNLVRKRTKAGRWYQVVEGGRHNRAGGFEADAEKYNAAGEIGWRVFRFTTNQVKSGIAVDVIEQVFNGEKAA